MSERPAGQRAARIMLVLAWVAALALATHWFGNWEEQKANPNRQPQSVHGDGYIEVSLASSRGGHYLLRDRTRAFLLLTRGRTLVLPRRDGKRVLLTLEQPQALLDALHAAR